MVKHKSGEESVIKNQEIDRFMRYRVPKFLSHVAYKKWAEDHGDVFSVEVKITLHVEEKIREPEWETISKKRFVLLVNIIIHFTFPQNYDFTHVYGAKACGVGGNMILVGTKEEIA